MGCKYCNEICLKWGKQKDGTQRYYCRTCKSISNHQINIGVNNGNLCTKEFNKYGSSLLGTEKLVIDVETPPSPPEIPVFVRGITDYLLNDHRGNNMSMVTDKKLQHSTDGTTIDYCLADVRAASYYSAYGAISKSFNDGQIDLVHNGQKRSTEISATAQTAEFWEYDGDVGRRWNVEPEINKYAGFSSYMVFRDDPILYADVDGKDIIVLTWVTRRGDPGHTAIAVRNYKEIKIKVNGKWKTVHTPTNTYTLYELGPMNSLPHSEAAFTKNYTPNYEPRYGVTYEEIMNNRLKEGGRVTKYDGFPADGALKIATSYNEDKKIVEKLEAKNDENKRYDTQTNNCTSYCSDVIPVPPDKKIDARETFEFGNKYTMETPIKLYTEIINLGPKVVIRLRLIPEELVKPIDDAFMNNPKRGGGKK